MTIPTNPLTGEPYLFTMMVGSRTVHADRNDELVAEILGEEYLSEGDPTNAFEIRLGGALNIATAVQESIVASAVRRGDLNDSEDESVWTPLLMPREIADAPAGDWNHPVPLVLVTSLFDPWTRRSAPRGNVVWIDPTDDVTLLESLQDCGLVRMVEHDLIEDAEGALR